MNFLIVRDAIILLLCLFAGKLIAHALPFVFPSSIIGMLVLFFCLTTGIFKLHQVETGANILLKYMALLFIPIGVGVMEYLELIGAQWPAIVGAMVIGTFIVLLVVGHMFQRLIK
ncbi:CidA/LrgA family protein [Motilimonas pumila]|uniref:Murein hydrolase regulator LrgA n=1 Tax=Motilimonas pumila TaxID=2303987 RepID=A0A418YDC7_9GAMM|nr:CidA/LrgA family protein [Motilimonas pumila]RJG42545.1 murein hydrolase regulator LrgA [Motilimonas pumila]